MWAAHSIFGVSFSQQKGNVRDIIEVQMEEMSKMQHRGA